MIAEHFCIVMRACNQSVISISALQTPHQQHVTEAFFPKCPPTTRLSHSFPPASAASWSPELTREPHHKRCAFPVRDFSGGRVLFTPAVVFLRCRKTHTTRTEPYRHIPAPHIRPFQSDGLIQGAGLPPSCFLTGAGYQPCINISPPSA